MPLRAQRRRKRLSMTSLIDVIFLLLLFFMLSSTFSRFAEVEIRTGGAGTAPNAESGERLFLRLVPGEITLNGRPLALVDLPERLQVQETNATLLVSVTREVDAQMLTDVLVALRPFPSLTISVLEAL